MTIFPTEVFLHPQFEGKKQGQNTSKLVNLVNRSKMPGQYLVQYDCVNCPLICHPSIGVIKNRVQIKLDLNTSHIGYYYKRLYILILNHVRSSLLMHGDSYLFVYKYTAVYKYLLVNIISFYAKFKKKSLFSPNRKIYLLLFR